MTEGTARQLRWLLQSERGALRSAGEGGWEWLPRGPVEQFAAAGPPEPVPPAPPLRSEQGVVDDWHRYVAEGVEPGISGRCNLETLAACEIVLRAAALGRAVARAELD